MKVLLIQPPTTEIMLTNNPQFVEDARGKNPPLGISYLASYLIEKTHHNVDMWDGEVDSGLIDILRFGNYDVIGISVLTFTLINTLHILDTIREYSPKSRIIVGGTHPTIYPKEMLALGVDKVAMGESETMFGRILAEINKDEHRIYS